MTLCIAALCQEGGDKYAAICFDQRVQTHIASAETEFKYVHLGPNWAALIAGQIPLARELTTAYKTMLRNPRPALNESNVLNYLYKPINSLRRSMASRYSQDRLAMDYDTLLRDGQKQLPEDLFRQVMYDVAAQEMKVELILIGWMNRRFNLFKLSFGNVYRCEPFAVIGSGTSVAEPALYHREVSEFWDMGKALYAVYEAQILGQIAPGVGKKYQVALLANDGQGIYPRVVKKTSKTFLAEKYAQYAPRELGDDFTLPAGFFLEFMPKGVRKPNAKTKRRNRRPRRA